MPQTWKKTFGIIWAGQFLSLVSSSAVNFAIIIWLSLEIGSAEVLAWAAIAGMLPQAVIGPIAGVFVDRWDRKRTMIFADAFVALCTAVMAVNFMMGNESLALIYVVLAFRSVGSAFHMPAMQASIPLLAPKDELLRIAGINQVIQSISTVAGPALGALAITLLPIGHVLWLDIAGALIAVTSLFFVSIPRQRQEGKVAQGVSDVIREIKMGLSDITGDRGLTMLFLYSVMVTFFVMPVAVLFPLLTTTHFGGGKWEMSVIEIIWGVGMLVGGGVLGAFKPAISKVVLINIMYVFMGAALSLSGYISSEMFILFVVLTGIGGVSLSVFNASFTTILQEQIPSERLGRVFSMYYSLAMFPSIIGLLGTGFLADTIGINWTFIILGLAIVIVGLVSFLTPSLMELGRRPHAGR